ncbi:condensation domain-containing protein [Streptomyces parvulus]|uniref:condensation domain-containing protein n=1 Tax=Streptomyces parvulus TaxID=146923 RepID=UPI0036F753D9
MSDRVELARVHAALMSLPGVRDAAVHRAGPVPGGRPIVAHVVTRTAPAELRAALGAVLPARLVPDRLHRVPHIPRHTDGTLDRRALHELTGPPHPRPQREPQPAPGPGPTPDPGRGPAPVPTPDPDPAPLPRSGPGPAAVPVPTPQPQPGPGPAAAPVPTSDPAPAPQAAVPLTPHTPGAAHTPHPDTPLPDTPGAAHTPHPDTPGPGTPGPDLPHPGTSTPRTHPDPPQPSPTAATVPLTPHQHTLLQDALAHPDPGRHVEQLHWRWRGPLDTDRFTAAWQSVTDRETVLRAAFDRHAPRLLLHEHTTVDVVRHPAGSVGFGHLSARDHTRGFDLHRPPLLRLNLLDEQTPPGSGPRVRILLTFQSLVLDVWSVSLLLQEFYRAYLAGGRLPGGERRPDIRDYARWLARQDTAPARDFWSRTPPPGTAPALPAAPGPATGLSGTGRAEARLGAAHTDRLRTWAASCAATETGALHTAWALLLYRAAAATGPATVGFNVTVPGRGIALDSVERLPGLLTNTLPLTVRVDPAASVTRLLAQLRDTALDIASYEWVSLAQAHRWSGHRPPQEPAQSVLVCENRRHGGDGLRRSLAAQGITVSPPRPAAARTLFPVTLSAHRDTDDGLVLTAVHDRSRLADTDAAHLVTQCARLLRELPGLRGGLASVTDALAALAGEPQVRMARPPAAATGPEPTSGEPPP